MTPLAPQLRMWLFASDTTSTPAYRRPVSRSGSIEKMYPDVWYRKLSGAGPSRLTMDTSARRSSVRTALFAVTRTPRTIRNRGRRSSTAT